MSLSAALSTAVSGLTAQSRALSAISGPTSPIPRPPPTRPLTSTSRPWSAERRARPPRPARSPRRRPRG
ncbi:hypothetical protein ACRAWD_22625 [Caulobacter segnis]